MTEDISSWPVHASAMGDRMRRHDWSTTPLGPAEEWSRSIRTLVDTVLAMGVPAVLVLGEKSIVCVCNDGYDQSMAQTGEALGRPLTSVWPSAGANLSSLLERARQGETCRDSLRLPLSKKGAGEAMLGDCFFSPVRDEAGGIVGALNTIVEAKPDESVDGQDLRQLRDSEHRLRALVEGIPQLVWRARDDGNWTLSSPQWENYTGMAADRSHGSGWLEAVHPDDREKALAAWRDAAEQDGFEADYRIYHRSEDRHRWFQMRARPVRDDRGAIMEWFGTSTDVDDFRRLRERERLALFELQHRVRNTLAVIRSIARRTAEHSDSVEDFAIHLEGRIDAFARIETGIAQVLGSGLDLATMIADELAVFAAREGREVSMEGPAIRLRPKAAELLGLSIHELATNAVKDGALSPAGGHIRVRWTIDDGETPMLRFEWKEKAVEPSKQLRKPNGFGTDLLRRWLVYELKATVDHKLESDGLRFAMEVPVSELAVEEGMAMNASIRNP